MESEGTFDLVVKTPIDHFAKRAYDVYKSHRGRDCMWDDEEESERFLFRDIVASVIRASYGEEFEVMRGKIDFVLRTDNGDRQAVINEIGISLGVMAEKHLKEVAEQEALFRGECLKSDTSTGYLNFLKSLRSADDMCLFGPKKERQREYRDTFKKIIDNRNDGVHDPFKVDETLEGMKELIDVFEEIVTGIEPDIGYLYEEFSDYTQRHYVHGKEYDIEAGFPDIEDFINRYSPDFFKKLSNAVRESEQVSLAHEFLDSLSYRLKGQLQFIIEEEVFYDDYFHDDGDPNMRRVFMSRGFGGGKDRLVERFPISSDKRKARNKRKRMRKKKKN